MKYINYQNHIGSTTACNNIMMEATKGIGQKQIKGSLKDFFLFDSWFSSKNSEEYSMEVGANLIGMVKKNTKGLYKDTLEKLTKDWT